MVRRYVLFTLFCLASATFSFAQQPVTFEHQTYVSSGGNIGLAADLNNDRATDIISNGPNPSVYVQLSNGDGSFQPPREYPAGGFVSAIAAGDLDGDGNADLVVLTHDASGNYTPGVTIFFGKGDGTFQPPVTVTNAAISFAQQVAIADFNGDGKRDIIVMDCGAGAHIFRNSGGRNFVYDKAINAVPWCGDINRLYVGDFDGDGHEDFAVETVHFAPRGNESQFDMTPFYNDGNANFTKGVGFGGLADNFEAVVADLNQDGKSDLVGLQTDRSTGADQTWLVAAYGSANRSLTETKLAIIPENSFAPMVGDFNGDGTLDVAFLANGTEFALQRADHTFEFQTSGYPVRPDLVGDFNRDGKLDIAELNRPATPPNTLETLLNTTAGGFGNFCAVAAHGINVCQPSAGAGTSSPVTFRASAADFSPVRKIELWEGSRKLTQQFYGYFDYAFLTASLPFTTGTHTVTFVAAGYDNDLMKKSVTFTVGSGSSCPAPASGINVCSPADGSTVAAQSSVHAVATGVSGTARMEVDVDGVRKALVSGSHLDVHFTLGTKGKRRLDFYSESSTGVKTAQKTIFITVQ